MQTRVRLGELLVEANILSREQLEEVLVLQKSDGRRLGTLLIEAGLVTETQVTQILSQQLSVPWVSLYHIDFSRQLLNLVPHELAEQYCLVPIFVRRVRGLGETLYVAMDDPSDESAQAAVGQYSGLAVRAMIAPPTDIRSAIRVYYAAGRDTASLSEAVAEVDAELAGRETPLMVEPTLVRSKNVAPPAPSLRPKSQAQGGAAVSATPASVSSSSGAAALAASMATPQSAPLAGVKPVTPQAAEETTSTSAGAGPMASAGRALASGGAAPALAATESPARRAEAGQPRSASVPSMRRVSTAPPIAPITSLPPAPTLDDDDAPQIESREVTMPAPKRGRPRKMVTLTLLDGTQVNLPAKQPRVPSEPAPNDASALTARDLVAALRAVAHGADATEILGENAGFEALFAALLSLLLKKHLIADWEFVEEFRNV